MDKDKKNDEELNNSQQNEEDNEKIDFDSMFEDDDITTWGVFGDGDRIAAAYMHSGK